MYQELGTNGSLFLHSSETTKIEINNPFTLIFKIGCYNVCVVTANS